MLYRYNSGLTDLIVEISNIENWNGIPIADCLIIAIKLNESSLHLAVGQLVSLYKTNLHPISDPNQLLKKII